MSIKAQDLVEDLSTAMGAVMGIVVSTAEPGPAADGILVFGISLVLPGMWEGLYRYAVLIPW